jgi:acetolactate synthase-1/2/3 large subunit
MTVMTGGEGLVAGLLEHRYRHGLAADLTNPDFVKFADSFGVAAERVSNPIAFKGALERALLDGGPHLIEIVVKDEVSPWRFIHPPKPDSA